uniref:CCHC-type domain-containing protein n=1 Tax=Lepisosteus oculatus TaxID=7918 RepID=W5MX83_LEPOC
RPLPVHMHNLYVPESELVCFLRRFVDIQGNGVKVMDSRNFWTGKRRYMVRLRTIATEKGGYVHPPAFFMIGSNGGHLNYPGQPFVCRNCATEGHVAAECTVICCRRCGEKGHRAEKCAKPLSCNFFKQICVLKTNQRTITVHTYNPYVPTERVTAYLGRYVTVVGKPTEIRDEGGVWYGKRQYRVLLKEDPEGVDGFQHPLARFNIGADRGYLYYPRMPDFCNKCSQFCHKASMCDIARCHNCNENGHLAKTCRAAKRCDGCGAEGHLLRQC